MNRAILTELATYTPTVCSYLNKEEKETVQQQIGLSTVHYYEWKRDMLTYRAVDVVEQACKEERDWIVYSILDRLGYENEQFINFIASAAAQYNREELLVWIISKCDVYYYDIVHDAARGGHMNIVYRMIELDVEDLDCIVKAAAEGAAEGGHIRILNEMINRGASNWNDIAVAAAIGGHKNMVDYMIRRGADDLDEIAEAAAEGCHREILDLMIELGADNWNSIAYRAAIGGHREIIDLMIELGADDWNSIANGAAIGGHRDIVLDMISRGADDLDEIAEDAAIGGHKEILNEMIDRGANDWDEMVRCAEEGGYKSILLLVLSRCGEELKDGVTQYQEHEDMRLYFNN